MKHLVVGMLLLIAAPLFGQTAPTREQLANDPDLFLGQARKLLKWDEPAEPAKLIGSVYFIGTKGLASFLITGSEGHIVINTGMPGSGELVEKSIKQLGFKITDVKMILAGHAHVDHVGGHAVLQKATGAKIAMLREEVELFESGGTRDFHYSAAKAFAFDKAKVDTIFRDEDTIKLGDITLKAHHTPGHTRGATSFTFTVTEAGQRYTVAIPDGMGVNPGYRLVHRPSYEGINNDYRRTFRTLEAIKPDVWFAPHNDVFDLAGKRERAVKEGVKAWVDPEGYKKWIATQKAKYEGVLDSEQRATPKK